jgi:hypothetical protein
MSQQDTNGTSGGGVQELRRHLNEVVTRLESITTRLNTEFISISVFNEYKKLQDEIHRGLREDVEDLKDDKKWLVRLVGGVVVVALLGVILVSNQAGAK